VSVKASAYVAPAAPATKAASTGAAPSPSSVSIYFAPKSSTLDTPAQRALRIAAAAYVGIGTEILITGYADKSGNAAANIELAKRRAQATRDALVKLGVDERRVKLAAPANAIGSDSDDQARRVDLVVKS
jgi:outer membrane protein OmpA-like peptidoglycan-associated protein